MNFQTKRRSKMVYIIIRRDDWFGLEIVQDCYAKPKQFRSENEADAYITEMELTETQIVEVTI
jgi:hypothetical protein